MATTSKPEKTREQLLSEMRAAAYQAVADHEADMKNDPAYRAAVQAHEKRSEAAAKRALKAGGMPRQF